MPFRILVVEDDSDQAALLSAFLGSQNYFVECATNGVDALRKARVGWFDVVLMDYRMPELDGLAAARLIEQVVAGRTPPRIVGLSATPEAVLSHTEANPGLFTAVIRKPWRPEALLSALRKATDGAATAEERRAFQALPTLEPVAPPAIEPDSNPRVLVIDDDALFAALLDTGLRTRGYGVQTAPDGVSALSRLRQGAFDVALVDYMLPDMDGLAVGRVTHDLLSRPDRPRLIALTATPEPIQKREAETVSVFDEIISKACGLLPLVEAVERCVAYRRLRRQSAITNVARLQWALEEAAAWPG